MNAARDPHSRWLLISPWLLWTAVGLYFVSNTLALTTERYLYSDGAHFFLRAITSLERWPLATDVLHPRYLADALNQSLLSLGLRLGITELSVLKVLFGLPLFFGNTVALFVCYRVSRTQGLPWPFLVALGYYVVFAMPSEIFPVNEAMVTFWVAYFLLLLQVLNYQPQPFHWALGLILAGLLFLCHENVLFFAPFGLVAGWFAWVRGSAGKRSLVAVLTAGWAAAFGFVLVWQLTHPLASLSSDYISLIKTVLNPLTVIRSNLFVSYSVLVCIVLLWLGQKKHRHPVAMRGVARIVLRALLVAHAIFLALVFGLGLFNPEAEVMRRVLLTIGGVVVFGLVTGGVVWPSSFRLSPRTGNRILAVVLLGLASHSVLQIGNSLNWNELRSRVKADLADHPGAILDPVELGYTDRTVVGNRYSWSWTWPCFSMVVGESNEFRALFLPLSSQEAFSVVAESRTVRFPFSEVGPSTPTLTAEAFFEARSGLEQRR
uniref:SpaB n=1 Tax=Spirochaeta aurantia TaxID=147 RepID=Q0PI06_SPIAU|nr:SpaB [Spirochaeta aurantia]